MSDPFEQTPRGLVQKLKGVPGVADAMVLFPGRVESGAPEMACQFLVFFASSRAIDELLSSVPALPDLLEAVSRVAVGLSGSMKHIDFEVSS